MKELNIVTVDNDEIFLFIMEQYFNLFEDIPSRIHPLFVNNAPMLLSEIESGYTPDIILLDLNMPVMDGFYFLEEYEKRGFHIQNPNTKIYILSSSVSRKDHLKSEEINLVTRFVVKTSDDSMIKEILSDYYNETQLTLA